MEEKSGTWAQWVGERFAPGLPVALLGVLGILCGMITLSQRGQVRADVEIWQFSILNSRHIREKVTDETTILEKFEARYGLSAHSRVMTIRALDTRFSSLITSGAKGEAVPDVVEIEIGSVGKYLRAPGEQIGLMSLNEMLEKSGMMQRLVKDRLATWSKMGEIYFIPRDVHPVVLVYRKDLWEEAGVDIEAAKTWAEFHQKAQAYEAYWHGKGMTQRKALELSPRAVDVPVMMLLQRGISLTTHDGKVHLTNAKVAETLLTFLRMCMGKRAVSREQAASFVFSTRDIEQGEVGAAICADWRLTFLRTYGAGMSGKVAVRGLPIFEPGDRPTSTWGGTGIGIPKGARDPEASFKFIMAAYFEPEGMRAWQAVSDILPPVRDAWTGEAYEAKDPFFSGQQVRRKLAELAEVVPERAVTPFTAAANTALLFVMEDAIRNQELDDAELLKVINQSLANRQERLERLIRFGAFE